MNRERRSQLSLADSNSIESENSTDPCEEVSGYSFQRLFRRVAFLGSTTTLSHIILIGFSPVLARIYNPSDFATFGFYQSAFAILSLAITLQFEQAIAIPASDRDAHQLLKMALRIAAILASILSIAFAVATLLGWFDGFWLSPVMLLVLPACALGESLTRTYRLDAVRHCRFKSMGASRISLVIGTLTAQVGLAFAGFSGLGLALGDGIGRWFSSIPLWMAKLWDRNSTSEMPEESTASMTSLAQRFRRFPTMMTPASIVTLVILGGPSLILPGLYGEEFAGQFAMANRLVLLPLMVISQAVTQVYISDASKHVREQDRSLSLLMRGTLKRMLVIGTVMTAGIMICGPILIPIVFGSRWQQAGNLVPLIAIGGLTQFVSGPLNQTLVLVQAELRNLILRVIAAGVVLGVLVGASVSGFSATVAVGAYAITLAVFGTVMCTQAFRCARKEVESWSRLEPVVILTQQQAA